MKKKEFVKIFAGAIIGLMQSGSLCSAVNYEISTVAGTGIYGNTGDGGPATSATLSSPHGVCISATDDIYIANTSSSNIRKVDDSTGNISTFIGGAYTGYYGGNPGTYNNSGVSSGALVDPYAMCFDVSGRLYVADTFNDVILMYDINGNVTTIAGTGVAGYSGDGGTAISAKLNKPYGIFVDHLGNIYVADTGNSCIRMFTLGGNISTIAGTGTVGNLGEAGLATLAQLNVPQAICADLASPPNIYIADTGNNCVKRFTVGGNITTIAGTGAAGYAGDGAAATSATLHSPQGICVNDASPPNVYVADTLNNAVRMIGADGIISTIAGTGVGGYSGDGGLATAAMLNAPQQISFDNLGSLFIADADNNRIRKLTPPTQSYTISSTTPENLPVSGVNTAIIGGGGKAVVPLGSQIKAVEIVDGELETSDPVDVIFNDIIGDPATLKTSAATTGQLTFNAPANLQVDTGITVLNRAPEGDKKMTKKGAATLAVDSDLSSSRVPVDIDEGTLEIREGAVLPNAGVPVEVDSVAKFTQNVGLGAVPSGLHIGSTGSIVVDANANVQQGTVGGSGLKVSSGGKIVLGANSTFSENVDVI